MRETLKCQICGKEIEEGEKVVLFSLSQAHRKGRLLLPTNIKAIAFHFKCFKETKMDIRSLLLSLILR